MRARAEAHTRAPIPDVFFFTRFVVLMIWAWSVCLFQNGGRVDNFENKIVLAPKITQNCPVRRIYFTLQVLLACLNFTIVLLDG